jgi:hypothetical protein
MRTRRADAQRATGSSAKGILRALSGIQHTGNVVSYIGEGDRLRTARGLAPMLQAYSAGMTRFFPNDGGSRA